MDDARAELLASRAGHAAKLSSSSKSDIRALYLDAAQAQQHHQLQQDKRYIDLAPTFLSLHHQAAASTQLLDGLQSFLSTFQSDLSSLSSHISALQTTSQAIDTRLDARRQIETELAHFLSEISLSPRVVDLFFETEPDAKVELWKKAVRQLERVIEATKSGAPPLVAAAAAAAPDASSSQGGQPPSTEHQAVKEAREVAELCKNIVASKLRAFLLAPYAAIRSSVTTNVQVLQTSILLQHHRPFYAFLARQMPRVAIDVQRTYVAAARLYFETAFRRYARSFGVIKSRWSETAGGLITDPHSASSSSSSSSSGAYGLGSASSAGAAAMVADLLRWGALWPGPDGPIATAFLSRPSSASSQAARGVASDGKGTAGPADPWELDVARLDNARLDGPGIVLGYMADDSSFRASPESLFRAISLVMVDNSCSEYTFLVRFFENLQDDTVVVVAPTPSALKAAAGDGSNGGALGDDGSRAGTAPGDEDAEPEAAAAEPEPEPSVVQLSRSEQRQMKGRGASDEIFKQVLEPALSTWTTFTKSLLTPAPPLLSLLTMLRLNETLLKLVESRGCSTPLVESALMGFKIQAFPILKRQFDEQIEALRRFNAGSGGGGGGADAGGGGGAGLMKGMFRVVASAGGGAASADATGTGRDEGVKMRADSDRPFLLLPFDRRLTSTAAHAVLSFDDDDEKVARRYASLFSRMVYLFEDDEDDGLFNNMMRLRNELEKSITSSRSPSSSTMKYDIILKGLEMGPASTSLPRIQAEISHWTESVRSAGMHQSA
ncbi:related to VPS52 - component of the Golgi-associated retrograde protein complex [Pseudozyma flocculosa]|uniref:Related to VPS52 - component of the Golgi-associated retrograde protein complex n=1 Tax=Pseudozyma flocculosa TaxID=84751 RepID=A0A5C3F1K0_9BASI|nr:related to VPS52 - component of the Golgi-associated retrograde protein complex [Pseudozyma flocculosa]